MEKNSTLELFLKVFHQQFIKSIKQWVVFGLLIFFFIFSVLLNNYINGFKHAFIEKLKGVYPITYIPSVGKTFPPPGNQFEHQKEFFHLTQSFSFKYTTDSKQLTIIDVALKAAPIDRLPVSLINTNTDDDTFQIWINHTMWERICNTKKYDGKGIYLISREKKEIYVRVNQFELLGTQPWVVFPENLFLLLGRSMNITTIYPKEQMNAKTVQKYYNANGIAINRWNEILPFFHFVFYHLSQRLFLFIMVGFLALLVVMALGVLQDTFDEFTKLITFSSRYGVSETFVQFFFINMISIYFLFIFSFSSGLVYYLNTAISQAIPVFQRIPTDQISIQHLLLIIPFLWIISFVLVHKKFKEQSQALEL